jgi:hypothetical protein
MFLFYVGKLRVSKVVPHTFEVLRKTSVSSILSVRMHASARLPLEEFLWNSTLWNLSQKIQIWLQSDKNFEYLTWRLAYVSLFPTTWLRHKSIVGCDIWLDSTKRRHCCVPLKLVTRTRHSYVIRTFPIFCRIKGVMLGLLLCSTLSSYTHKVMLKLSLCLIKH